VTLLIVGGFLAVIVSLGTAFTLDYLDSSFRTPAEVLSELNIPVLGAISLEQSGLYSSWNGNGHGNGRPRVEVNVHGRDSGHTELREQ
jgi:cobalamin biosynthesis Mg chelatase CobN